jgi:hypothetical protein
MGVSKVPQSEVCRRTPSYRNTCTADVKISSERITKCFQFKLFSSTRTLSTKPMLSHSIFYHFSSDPHSAYPGGPPVSQNQTICSNSHPDSQKSKFQFSTTREYARPLSFKHTLMSNPPISECRMHITLLRRCGSDDIGVLPMIPALRPRTPPLRAIIITCLCLGLRHDASVLQVRMRNFRPTGVFFMPTESR